VDRSGALLEAVVHPLEALQEVAEVREHLLPGEPRQGLRDVAAAELGEAEPELAGADGGREERAGGVVAQEVEDAVGRLEEVEGVGGGGVSRTMTS
jgi:hypothetical protein